MTFLDASLDVSLDEVELDPGMLGGDVEECLAVARGYEPGVEGLSTVEQPDKQLADLGTGEIQL